MKRVFISHCSDDIAVMEQIKPTLDAVFASELAWFCTYDNSITAGKDRGPEIRQELAACDAMIAVITDSYMRSVICLAELSAMWAKKGALIPIVFNGDAGREMLEKLYGEAVIVVNADKPDAGRMLADALTKHFGIPAERAALAHGWVTAAQSNPDLPPAGHSPRPYIGSGSSYDSFIRYCASSGIRRIQEKSLDTEYMQKQLVGKKEVYLVGTTLKGLLLNNTDTFAEVLAAGGDLYVLIANLHSDFCEDVAEIESFPSQQPPNDLFSSQLLTEQERLEKEFGTVRGQLSSIIHKAHRAQQPGRQTGRLFFGDAGTLVRQTVTAGIDDGRNLLWAWVSVTMPPKRAASGTMSFEVEAAADDFNDKNRTLAENIKDYVREICGYARRRGTLTEITPQGVIPEHFPYDTPAYMAHAQQEWEKVYADAVQDSKLRSLLNPDKVLIEVAAQHPLRDGKTPDTAFRMRLDRAAALYRELCAAGKTCSIYVPGSLHNGDSVSLSSAGIGYLMQSGAVKPEDILPETVNALFKGSDGVYNSADECFTAAQLFRNGAFGALHCVCSANQMVRKTLFYWRFGVVPQMHTVPDDSFHSSLYELFTGVPDVLLNDHDWQDPEAHHVRRSQAERMPGFQEKT